MSATDMLVITAWTFVKGVIFLVASFWIWVISPQWLSLFFFVIIIVQWYHKQLLVRALHRKLIYDDEHENCDYAENIGRKFE